MLKTSLFSCLVVLGMFGCKHHGAGLWSQVSPQGPFRSGEPDPVVWVDPGSEGKLLVVHRRT